MEKMFSKNCSVASKQRFTKQFKLTFCVTALGFGLLSAGYAQSSISIASGDWNVAENWENGVPETARNTGIRDGYTIDLSTAGTSGALYVGENNNNGTLNIGSGGSLAVTGQSYLASSNNGRGTININGGSFSASSHFNFARGNNAIGYMTISNGGSLSVAQQLRLADSGSNATASLTIDGGTLTATNFYIGNANNSAVFTVKGSGSTITVGANLTVGTGSTVAFELGAAGASVINGGNITIAGGATGGILDLSVLAGIDPSTLPETILLMNANGALSGTFATVNWGDLDSSKWALQYDAKTLSLVYSIPEPTTVALLLAAASFGGVCLVRRRRKTA